MSTKPNVPEAEDECRVTSEETSNDALGGFCEVDIARVVALVTELSKPCALMELLCCSSEPDGVFVVLDLGLSSCPLRDLPRGDLLISSLDNPAPAIFCLWPWDSLLKVTSEGCPSFLDSVSELCPGIFKVNLCAIGGTAVPTFNFTRDISGVASTSRGFGTSFLASATRRWK